MNRYSWGDVVLFALAAALCGPLVFHLIEMIVDLFTERTVWLLLSRLWLR